MRKPPRTVQIDLAAIAQYILGGLAIGILGLLSLSLFGGAPVQPEDQTSFLLVTARPTNVPSPTPDLDVSDFSFIVTPTPGGQLFVELPTPIYVTAPPSLYPPPRVRNGFQFGGQVHDFSNNAVDKMHYSGMGWVKFQVREGDRDVQDKIKLGHERGFQVLVSILGDADQVENPSYHRRFADYAQQVALMGANAIEIWNEPNIARDWPVGKIDPGLYLQILKPSYEAIKAANSNTLVISAGLAPTLMSESLRSANFWTEVDYTTQFVEDGGLYYVDCMGIHYNIGITPPTQRDDSRTGDAAFFYYPQLLEHYASVTQNTRPVCFTEFGILTDEGYEPIEQIAPDFIWASNTTLQNQGEWLAESVRLSLSNPLVEMLIVWNVDFWQYGRDPHAGYAIIRQGGGCPSCDYLNALGLGR